MLRRSSLRQKRSASPGSCVLSSLRILHPKSRMLNQCFTPKSSSWCAGVCASNQPSEIRHARHRRHIQSDRGKKNSARNLVEPSLYVNHGTAQMPSRGRITVPEILRHKGAGFLPSGVELDSQDVDTSSASGRTGRLGTLRRLRAGQESSALPRQRFLRRSARRRCRGCSLASYNTRDHTGRDDQTSKLF